MAKTFAVDTYMIGYIFSLFSIGYCAAILINGYLLGRVSIGKELLVAVVIVMAAVLGGTSAPNLTLFAICIFLYGIGSGILYSACYYIIISLYTGPARTAQLNFINFFYGVGAIIAPATAGILLQNGVRWETIYQATLLILLLFAGVLLTKHTAITARLAQMTGYATDSTIPQGKERWPRKVFFIGLSLFFYVLSELIFCFWIVVYLVDNLGVEVSFAGFSVSVFWIFIAAGRLLCGFLANRFLTGRQAIIRFILISSSSACLCTAWLLQITEPLLLFVLIAGMGLGYAGLYASILAYGTMQLSWSSPKLLSFFLTVSSAGSIAALLLSSFLKQSFGVKTALLFSAIFMALVFITIVASSFHRPRQSV